MTRAPFVMGKADSAFSRAAKIEDTTIGWRFVNPLMKAKYGIDSMPETAENVAREFNVSRADQDAFAMRSQQRWARAHAAGFFKDEIVPVTMPQKKGESRVFDTDEHPRPDTTIEMLAKLKGVVTPDGSVTAGNASGVNDGACALLIASGGAAERFGLKPRARIVGMATAGLAPRIMGFGPSPATKKVLAHDRPDHRPDGRDRTERSVCRAGPGRHARPRPGRRRRARQPERRRDRDRPPAGRIRRAPGDDRGQPAAPHRRPLRAVHHVHRRRPGHRH